MLATSPLGFSTENNTRLSKRGEMESVYAGQLEEGDRLLKMRAKEKRLVREEVVAVEGELESGFWAPLTKEGTLLVDSWWTPTRIRGLEDLQTSSIFHFIIFPHAILYVYFCLLLAVLLSLQ